MQAAPLKRQGVYGHRNCGRRLGAYAAQFVRSCRRVTGRFVGKPKRTRWSNQFESIAARLSWSGPGHAGINGIKRHRCQFLIPTCPDSVYACDIEEISRSQSSWNLCDVSKERTLELVRTRSNSALEERSFGWRICSRSRGGEVNCPEIKVEGRTMRRHLPAF